LPDTSISSFTASVNPDDTNLATTLTVAYTGGSGTYTEAYTGLPFGCVNLNATSDPCTPLASGTFVVRVFVNDTLTYSTSATVRLLVNPDPTISTFTATPNPLDANATTTLTVSASGGTGTLKYAYTGLPAGCASANLASISCTPTVSGTFMVTVYVNDTLTYSTSSFVILFVNSDPKITTFTASPNPVKIDATTTLALSATGGSGIYSYTYTGLPTGCSSADLSLILCTPTAGGTFTVRVFVNDTLSYSVNATLILVVITNITVSSFTASPNPTDANLATTLIVSASGGSGIYTYNYTGLPTGCSSANLSSISCTPTVNGTFVVRVFVNDTLGYSSSLTLVLTVNADPTISSFVASPNPINIGQTTYLNVTAYGGAAPLSYTYTALPTGCVSSDTNALKCVPVACGTFPAQVSVTDAASYLVNKSLSLVVVCGYTISSFTASLNPTDVNVATLLTVATNAGPGTYTYTYAGLPTGCSTSNVTSLSCVPTASGSFVVRVFVNDTQPYSVSATLTLTVNAAPSITSFVASPGTTDVGKPVTLMITATGGTTPYAYAYAGLPSGCTSSNKVSMACTPSASGTFSIRAYANDSVGGSATNTLKLEVNAALSITSFAASLNPTNIGVSTTLTVAVTGGATPYVYVYTGLPTGCSSSNAASLTCTPTVAGTFTVRVFVNDSLGISVTQTLSLSVSQEVAISSFTASPNHTEVGASAKLAVTTTGSAKTLSYAYAGLPAGCSSVNNRTLTCTPAASGTFTVRVYVNVSLGVSVSATASLKVNAAPTITSFTASRNPTNVSIATNLNVSVSGGFTPYSYAYSGLPAGCTTSNTASLTCTPSTSGTFTIRIYVNDSFGVSATTTLSLKVNGASSSTQTVMGLSVSAWYVIVGIVVLIAILLLLALLFRRRKSRPAEEPKPVEGTAAAAAGTEGVKPKAEETEESSPKSEVTEPTAPKTEETGEAPSQAEETKETSPEPEKAEEKSTPNEETEEAQPKAETTDATPTETGGAKEAPPKTGETDVTPPAAEKTEDASSKTEEAAPKTDETGLSSSGAEKVERPTRKRWRFSRKTEKTRQKSPEMREGEDRPALGPDGPAT
jgi:outer membrane biosynthesis protein TonB